METRTFKKTDLLIGWVVFAISAAVYLATIEPTASFWDCGEFIASSYKLEVGHPPGNPTYQLLGRLFSMFGSNQQAAMLINAMSALASAFCVLLLFWTISHLGRRLLETQKIRLNTGNAIAIWGAAAVGSLVYSFSDTAWFSAVEAEVYGMSSLFTAAVFWAMLKWEENADKPHANRWIVLIAYLMGLSIGVHLLNLLTIPALVFIYFYKKYTFSWKGAVLTLLLSVVIIVIILYGIIPWLPRISGWFDLLFVNVFRLPYNSGMLFFVVSLVAALFWGVVATHRKGKVLWNTILLCLTVIIIGYASFAMVVIRSSAKTPTNENQPDNPFALDKYLAREQYGAAPLLYDGIYNSPYDTWKNTRQYVKMDGKYARVKGPEVPLYKDADKMFFPRMWSKRETHGSFYDSYNTGKGKVNSEGKSMPSFGDNMVFFFDYQVNYMYWRYFMWNFAGRQNDIQGTIPGDPVRGNWESGIGFLDRARLGDQSKAPEMLAGNKAKNHYYMLPLLLGIAGLLYQTAKDRRNAWITFLLFFLTGLAIVVYLNQPPYQPRERDYAYAGSFYAFSIWVGLGVVALYHLLRKKLPGILAGSLASALCLFVPFQMLAQNWDDHDRSGRYTARDFAFNFLTTCREDCNAIIVTHGDNDTFPLWYAQEVEGIRTDVRVMNTSLLGTDWYIDQMQWKMYTSAPVKFSIPRESYLYGTNEILPVYERVTDRVPAIQAVSVMGNPRAKLQLNDGTMINYLPARKLRIPVNKENVLACGIVPQKDAHLIPEYMDLDIPENKHTLMKVEMMFLDMLANYEWDRPIYIVSRGGDLNIGIRDYLRYDGMAYKLMPFKTENIRPEVPYMDTDKLYPLLMEGYRWGRMEEPGVLLDYHVTYLFLVQQAVRQMYSQVAKALILEGKTDKAEKILDRGMEIMKRYPLNYAVQPSLNEVGVMETVELYYFLERPEKARDIAVPFLEETYKAIGYFLGSYKGGFLSSSDAESAISTYVHMNDILKVNGDAELSESYSERIETFFKAYQ
ncbi:MAG: DUF2723 domain-containing protein [Bacteroidales bacterium]|jgi:hypothetical protein|nr:DUF2723 domain-containing protein [Bacteroidales bacterium]MDD2823861.1 DUF2723 domain-containing protein [Bacteroidales bacterium]MDD3100340.1 DUF2723 domain-containing protein [Bacteroidales bacterium]MDD3639219.1 DUF2723 domain-containing protein [Bacteroidales bacterium]MDD3943910.1 DUF2723 domain-containing protein [Bacteroidales bacterium]